MAFNRQPSRPISLFSSSSSSHSVPMDIGADIPDAAIVSEDYIKILLKKIEDNFPKKDSIFTWRYEAYPASALNDAYIKNGSRTENSTRYNPFRLRLIRELQDYTQFHDHTKIRDNEHAPFTEKIARTDYLNFIRVYNFAYINILKALNGSHDAIELVKKSFSEQTTLFSDANVKWEFINSHSIKTEKNKFLLALLACLILDIVFSKDTNISTEARMTALTFLKTNFKVRDVTAAFIEFKDGYEYRDTEEVFNMVPSKFLASRDERVGTTAHNKLFLKNATIEAIFPRISYGRDFYKFQFNNEAFNKLFSYYPEESAQVLSSFIKVSSAEVDKAYIFMAILEIADFPLKKQEKILGIRASYRNADEQHNLQIQLNADEDGKAALELRIKSNVDDIKLNQSSDRKVSNVNARTSAKENNLTPELARFIKVRERVAPNKYNTTLSANYGLDPELYNLMCFISMDFPDVPVYLKGKLYDYSSLEPSITLDGYVSDLDRVQHPLDHIQPALEAQAQMDKLFEQQEKIAREKAATPVTDESKKLSFMELVIIWQKFQTSPVLKGKSSSEANEVFNACIVAKTDQIRYATLRNFLKIESRDVEFKQYLISQYGKNLFIKHDEAPQLNMSFRP